MKISQLLSPLRRGFFRSLEPVPQIPNVTIHLGDALTVLRTLPTETVQTCVTSPPYYALRDYGISGQMGLEKTPDLFVKSLVAVFREVRRVLRNDGTLWLNLGDTYAARDALPIKRKDLIGIPWRVALALQADGWYLRQDIVWDKPNAVPESAADRCVKSHEYIFLLSKSPSYYFDRDSIREVTGRESTWEEYNKSAGLTMFSHHNNSLIRGRTGTLRPGVKGLVHPLGRGRRSVWRVASSARPNGEHHATYPTALVEPCVKSGSKAGDTVLDPFSGSGTTGLVAKQLSRRYIGIELNPSYARASRLRIAAG